MIGSSRVRVDSGWQTVSSISGAESGEEEEAEEEEVEEESSSSSALVALTRSSCSRQPPRWLLLLHLLHLLHLLRLRLLLLFRLWATDATHCLPPTIHPYPATTDHVAPVRPLPLVALSRSSCPRQPPRLLLLLRLRLLLPLPLLCATDATHWTVAKNPRWTVAKNPSPWRRSQKKTRLSRKVATVWKSPCYCP